MCSKSLEVRVTVELKNKGAPMTFNGFKSLKGAIYMCRHPILFFPNKIQ